jgi:hypothetical protein
MEEKPLAGTIAQGNNKIYEAERTPLGNHEKNIIIIPAAVP